MEALAGGPAAHGAECRYTGGQRHFIDAAAKVAEVHSSHQRDPGGFTDDP